MTPRRPRPPSTTPSEERATATDDDGPEIDIAALLAMTFEARPSNDMAQRVEARVALQATVGELTRLLLVSPWHWVRADDTSLTDTSPTRGDEQ